LDAEAHLGTILLKAFATTSRKAVAAAPAAAVRAIRVSTPAATSARRHRTGSSLSKPAGTGPGTPRSPGERVRGIAASRGRQRLIAASRRQSVHGNMERVRDRCDPAPRPSMHATAPAVRTFAASILVGGLR